VPVEFGRRRCGRGSGGGKRENRLEGGSWSLGEKILVRLYPIVNLTEGRQQRSQKKKRSKKKDRGVESL